MTVVVSDEEKAYMMRQVGTRKASVSEPLMTCRDQEVAPKPGHPSSPGTSLAGTRLLARWCPARRRRDPDLPLPCGTGEGGRRRRPPGWEKGSVPSGRNRKGLSTESGSAGGP